MQIIKKLRGKGREIKSSAHLLYRGLSDPRMPFYVKVLAFFIIAYILSPIDIIPDFIPALGLLDEIILVPIMLAFTVSLIPEDIRHEYEKEETLENEDKQIENQHLSHIGSVIILMIWCVFIGLGMYYFEIIKF